MAIQFDSVNPKKTAVLVIDMQNDFLKEESPMACAMGRAFLPKMADFLDRCRKMGMMVVYTEQVHRPDWSDMGYLSQLWPANDDMSRLLRGTEGAKTHSAIAPQDGDLVLEKHRYSAFHNTPLNTNLTACGIDSVVVIGVTTDVCCFSTARDAFMYNYRVAFLSDLNGVSPFLDHGLGAGNAELQQEWTLKNVAATCGKVMTSEEFLKLPHTDEPALKTRWKR